MSNDKYEPKPSKEGFGGDDGTIDAWAKEHILPEILMRSERSDEQEFWICLQASLNAERNADYPNHILVESVDGLFERFWKLYGQKKRDEFFSAENFERAKKLKAENKKLRESAKDSLRDEFRVAAEEMNARNAKIHEAQKAEIKKKDREIARLKRKIAKLEEMK